MDALNTEKVSAKECRDAMDLVSKLAKKAGSALQLDRAAHLKRASLVLQKAADTED